MNCKYSIEKKIIEWQDIQARKGQCYNKPNSLNNMPQLAQCLGQESEYSFTLLRILVLQSHRGTTGQQSLVTVTKVKKWVGATQKMSAL